MKNIFYQILTLTLLLPTVSLSQWNKQDSKTKNMLLSVSFINSSVGYASGGKETIVKTVNGGYSWQVCHIDSFSSNALYSIVSANTDTIVAVGDQVIMYSHNTGLSWTKVASATGVKWRKVKYINGKFYAMGQFGILSVSSDYGKTWVSNTIASNDIYDLQTIDSLNWVICGNSALFLKSKDGGKTWKSSNVNTNGKGNLLIGTYFKDLNNGYVVGENGIFQQTNDGGLTWKDVLSNFNNTFLSSILFLNPNEGIAVGGDIYNNTFKVYFTKDGGISWDTDSSSNLNSRIYGIGRLDNKFVLSDLTGGIYVGKSGNGSNSNSSQHNSVTKKSINCYPNPNAGYFTLDLPEGFKGIAKNISIYNDMGVLMNNQEIQNEEIDMTGYAPGTYFIGIFHKTTVFYSKVIIIKQT